MINELEFKFPAKLENVQTSRAILLGFLVDLDLPMTLINELKTALSEAVTNAIVHGYENDDTKNVTVKLAYDEYFIHMTIIDYGIGIENIEAAKEPLYSSKFEEERAGLGFTIMEVFTDSLTIDSTVGSGTKIIMKKSYV